MGFRAEGEGRLQEVWIWGKEKGVCGRSKDQEERKGGVQGMRTSGFMER